MTQNKYDAVVVGAGAGGGASAWALANKGFRVLLLDAGPRFSAEKDYKIDTPQWEQGFPHKAGSRGQHSFAPMQTLYPEYDHLRSWNHISGRLNPTDQRTSFGYHHVLGVGGSSLHFTGEAHRLNPKSMKMFTQFGVAADWPLTYEQLEPFYSQAEHIVGVAGPENVISRPRKQPYPYASHPLSYLSKKLKNSFNQRGLELVANSLAVLPEARPGRLNCNYCGCCLKGCPRNDKGSIDVTYLNDPLVKTHCDIRPGATVTHIETAEHDRIKGLHYIDADGEHFVETPILVLAAGAVETPRLLLNARSARSPDGLANESGQVGKNFMETILWTSNALHPDALGSHRGLPVDSICWDFNAPDAIQDVIGGCRFSPSVAESDLLGPINYAQRVVPGWGRYHKQLMRERFGRVMSISGLAESLPHPKTYIDLEPLKIDENGRPIARIHSYLDEMAIKRIEFMAKMCRDLLHEAGATDIFEEFSSYDIFSSTHVFGTCRMGEDSENSVVNKDCRSHRWKNLYITDASVFPSSGGGESPGLTIQALALRAISKIQQ